MNNCVLSATVSDAAGSMRFKFDVKKSEIYSLERRVTRRATLDGGSVTEDYGFTDSDRTFTIVAVLTKTQIESLEYLVRTFSSIVISTVAGLFLASFESTRVKGQEVTIKLLIKEKLA